MKLFLENLAARSLRRRCVTRASCAGTQAAIAIFHGADVDLVICAGQQSFHVADMIQDDR